MSVTALFIDDSWTLQSRIMRFIYVPCPHTKGVLCDQLYECLMDWNLDRKILCVTVDNCSANNAMIELMLDKLDNSSLLANGIQYLIGLQHLKWRKILKKRPDNKKRKKVDMIKSELDLYLDEDVWTKAEGFDVLSWWKLNEPKYPTLACMARDILIVPASSVASESAFSSIGRLVSPHHNRLHPCTIEALMCAQSWSWAAEMKESTMAKELLALTPVVNLWLHSKCPTSLTEFVVSAPLTPLLKADVGVRPIAIRDDCSLSVQAWYLDDGIVIGDSVELFPRDICRPQVGVRLLGGAISMDASFIEDFANMRVSKSKELMGVLEQFNDPQCELVLLRVCMGLRKLCYALRTCPPSFFTEASAQFDAALRKALHNVVNQKVPDLVLFNGD
ncbi:hypothetical protein POM88_054364 [Heracleum sosnowskyi]|uniref:HAT C-terminal dimerisation domain-containing protein n=1 Tax=Heracleum sosnowskyi TaxID=360622 RepID=A0AAD8GNQ0_9APIA|nr:hypothetical protein POM88_054364 [Heracleum sosnowskyi]